MTSTKLTTLERIKFGQMLDVAAKLLNEPEITITEKILAEQLRIVISGYLYGEKAGTKIIEYPATWWEAFKARWFPGWLRRRLPVRLTVHHLDFYNVYPNFRPTMPNQASAPVIAEWREDRTADNAGRERVRYNEQRERTPRN